MCRLYRWDRVGAAVKRAKSDHKSPPTSRFHREGIESDPPPISAGLQDRQLLDLLTTQNMRPSALAFRLGLPVVVFASVILAPNPEGLTDQGQRALAVVLWATETLHIAVTGMVGIVLLVLVDAVDDVGVALYGFSQPVTYFLVGILTLGLAVQQSGLAERLAVYLIRLAGGSPRKLYVQMLVSFAALTFALPSASTRGAIMVHVCEQVLAHWRVEKSAPLNKAVMIAIGSLNRLGSTALLAGGITPVVASALIADSGLIGDFSWTRWFILMALPFYTILIIGGAAVLFLYRSVFKLLDGVDTSALTTGPLQKKEIRAGLIALGTALLWFTDFVHGLPPTVPALIAMTIILLPGIGLLSWREFEQNVGWTNFFVIASSLSLANALIASGSAAWFADTLVGSVGGLRDSPLLDNAGDVRSRCGRADGHAQHLGLSGLHNPGGHVHRRGPGSEPGGLRPGGGRRWRLDRVLPRRGHGQRLYLPAGGDPGPGGIPHGRDYDGDCHRGSVLRDPALLGPGGRKPYSMT